MVTILLTCGHVYVINELPRVDEPCEQCKAIRVVVDYWQTQWHSLCKECAYHRTHGYSRKYADDAAALHHGKTLHNVSVLWYADVPQHIRTLVREARTAKKNLGNPAEDASPPF